MDRFISKQAKAAVVSTMQNLTRSAGFKTRSQTHFASREGFWFDFDSTYLDSRSKQFPEGQARVMVRLRAKPIESDEILWRICQMENDLARHSVDPIFGLDVVPSLEFARQVFPIQVPSDAPHVCAEVLEFAVDGFGSFMARIGNASGGFYRFVVGLDPTTVAGDELLFPIAFIYLGECLAALQFLEHRGRHSGRLGHLSRGRALGDYLADFCMAGCDVTGQPSAGAEPSSGARLS